MIRHKKVCIKSQYYEMEFCPRLDTNDNDTSFI